MELCRSTALYFYYIRLSLAYYNMAYVELILSCLKQIDSWFFGQKTSFNIQLV